VTDETRLQEMIADACLGAGSEASLTADLRGFLEAHGVAEEDVAAILASPPRLLLYRRLVRNNLTGVTEKMLARTRARLEEISPGAFDASFDAFLDAVGPRTHYLRDVPGEFLSWVEERWRAQADLPRWIADLAKHELAHFQVAAAEVATTEPRVTEIAPDRGLVFAEHARLARFDFAVHALPRDASDRTEPAERPTSLVLYRDEDDAVQELEVTPLGAVTLRRLLGGETIASAVQGATAEVARTPEVLDVAALLADLAERGVILGGRP
jgi:hypothetical protein